MRLGVRVHMHWKHLFCMSLDSVLAHMCRHTGPLSERFREYSSLHAGEDGPASDGSGMQWWEAWDNTGRFAARKRKRAEEKPLCEDEQAWRQQLTLQSLQVPFLAHAVADFGTCCNILLSYAWSGCLMQRVCGAGTSRGSHEAAKQAAGKGGQ